MPQNTFSEDYGTLLVRDVNESFETLVASKPTFIGVIGYDPEKNVTNTKHEWLNDILQPFSWTVNGASLAASTDLVFDSNSGLRVGDILSFKASTGASISVKARVVTVNANGTAVTIQRLGTDADITDDAVASLIASPRGEFSDEELKDNGKPTTDYNYTQIFRRDFPLSRTLVQSRLYGLSGEALAARAAGLVDYQINFHMDKIMRELNLSALLGYRELRAEADDHRGLMGGALPFMEAQAATKYDASSAAISATILNNALAQSIENGADTTSLTTMVMHHRQARKISAFLGSPTYTLQESVAGNRVVGFKSDLPADAGGSIAKVVVDPNFPEDKIAIISPSDLTIKTMENLMVEETTSKKSDGYTWKMLAELTLEYKNAAVNSMLIHNLGL